MTAARLNRGFAYSLRKAAECLEKRDEEMPVSALLPALRFSLVADMHGEAMLRRHEGNDAPVPGWPPAQQQAAEAMGEGAKAWSSLVFGLPLSGEGK